MAVVRSGSVLRQIGELFSVGAAGTLSDAQLVAGFLGCRGEASESAFAALVERHGPMVLRVCRILLRDAHEAEDAFQATFLVLARKAGSVRDPDRLANWLYGVAHRVARKARSRAGRRRLHETGGDEMAGLEFAGREQPLDLALAHREEAAIVHRELERLPDRLRTAIVLCCLEELTIEEAARRISCTPGAVRGRLARARSRLEARLARRGVEVPAGVVAAALSTRTASAAVTTAVRDATMKAAMAYAAGMASAGGASGTAPALADGVSRTMPASRLAIAAICVAGVTAAVGTIVTPSRRQGPPGAGAARQTVSVSPEAKLKAPEVAGPGAGDLRRLVEELDWFLIGVDPERGTISLEDLPDPRGGESIALTTAPGGIGPTGLTLGGLAVGPGARVTIDGTPAGLEALRPGMRAAVRMAPDRFAASEVRASSAQPPAFLYVLEDVDADARTMTVILKQKTLKLEKIRIAEDARIHRIRTRPVGAGPDSTIRKDEISLRDLRPGMPVSLTLVVTEGGGLVARSIKSGDAPDDQESSP